MKLIELDRATTERCVQFGHAIVQRYAAGETPRSLAVSSHGAESNPRVQARAKMAECILAVWLGLALDPLFEQSLRPWDLRTARSRIDVKQTGLNGQYLIWPKRKNDIFAAKEFDLLVLVKNDWNAGAPRGWIEKEDFFRLKSVAGEGHKLDPGTWYVDQELLEAMDRLPGYVPPVALPVLASFAPPMAFAPRFERLEWVDVVGPGIGRFRCDCGQEIVAEIGVITRSRAKNCGCLSPALVSTRRRRAA
jgi:hypothetical protein